MRISDWSSDVCSSDLRHIFINERDGAVLHLAGSIAFGMEIADFLELERAFKCYWIVGPTAEIQYVSCHRDLGGDRLDRVLISKGSIERGGRFSQMLDDCMLILDRQPPLGARQIGGERGEYR